MPATLAHNPTDPDFGKEADPGRISLLAVKARIALGQGWLRRIAYWDRDRIEQRRDRHLRRMIHFASETVPYYRRALEERGLSPDRIRTLGDMRLLPVIGDPEMRRDAVQFVSSQHAPEGCYRFFTGGSTGVRKAVYHEPLSLFWNSAYACRDQEITRAILGPPVARRLRFLFISPGGSNLHRFDVINRRGTVRPRLRDRPRLWVDATWPLSRQVESINAGAPDVISAYALTLHHIYEQACLRGLELHRPKLFLLHSEGLPPEKRAFLQETLGVPVYMLYSCIEARKVGYECEIRDGYHIHEDICPVRILDEDGHPAPPGIPGRVVISNLINRGSVLLNFDLGDEGTIDETPCPCGRSFHRLRITHARCIPPLQVPGEDRSITYTEFMAYFRGREGLKQFQLIVEAPDRWTLGLVMDDPDSARAWLPEALERIRRELTGPSIHLEARMMERAETTPAGKTLPIVIRVAEAH